MISTGNLLFVLCFTRLVKSQCNPFVYDKTKPYTSGGLVADYNSKNIQQQNGLLNLLLTNPEGGTRLSIRDTLHYGKVEVKMRIASGLNVVSSFILMADNKDEIDFEFVQNTLNKTNVIQTNYFYRGIPIFDKNAKMYKTRNPLANFYHTYTINWTPDRYEWSFNGNLLRTLYKNTTKNYPDSPSKVQFGIWAANPSSWAGPGINWSSDPFVLSIESISVSCNKNTPDLPTSSTSVVPTSVVPTPSSNPSPISSSSNLNYDWNTLLILVFSCLF
jgi:beta-glucanase (GH16 family)